jgi:2-(1,2-epoxy-1,2-dihydrophenyl)acetyl-CoA isomerase
VHVRGALRVTLRAALAEGVLTLTLDRPDVLNAVDSALAAALLSALRAASARDEVRAVRLRGAGRAFCAGRDLNAPPDATLLRLVQDVARTLVALPQPVVCAVHGWAVGLGFEWMLACDVVVAARGARFRLPEAGLGVAVTGGVLRTLPAFAGLARARAHLMLGDTFGAEQAWREGLLGSVVDDADLDPASLAAAQRLAALEPRVARAYKRALNEIGLDRFERALDLEARLQAELEASRPAEP